MAIIDICINCPDTDVATAIAETLISEHLVACANILGPIQSLYRWQGTVERETEIPLLVKTRANLFDAVSTRVAALHPYDVPSIVGLPVAFVNPAYRDWVFAETS